jgi:hypothetical protein
MLAIVPASQLQASPAIPFAPIFLWAPRGSDGLCDPPHRPASSFSRLSITCYPPKLKVKSAVKPHSVLRKRLVEEPGTPTQPGTITSPPLSQEFIGQLVNRVPPIPQ